MTDNTTCRATCVKWIPPYYEFDIRHNSKEGYITELRETITKYWPGFKKDPFAYDILLDNICDSVQEYKIRPKVFKHVFDRIFGNFRTYTKFADMVNNAHNLNKETRITIRRDYAQKVISGKDYDFEEEREWLNSIPKSWQLYQYGPQEEQSLYEICAEGYEGFEGATQAQQEELMLEITDLNPYASPRVDPRVPIKIDLVAISKDGNKEKMSEVVKKPEINFLARDGPYLLLPSKEEAQQYLK